jgi:hypothetical protein
MQAELEDLWRAQEEEYDSAWDNEQGEAVPSSSHHAHSHTEGQLQGNIHRQPPLPQPYDPNSPLSMAPHKSHGHRATNLFNYPSTMAQLIPPNS